jgi:hypothetical protein
MDDLKFNRISIYWRSINHLSLIHEKLISQTPLKQCGSNSVEVPCVALIPGYNRVDRI